MAIEHHFQARTAAGRLAVAVANAHSPEVAADMLRGFLSAFIVACAEVNGWPDTLRVINEFATVTFPKESKIRLVVNNE